MVDELKKKTVIGFAYKFAERAGAQGISFLVQIVLARLLLPEHYGLIALVSVFITICDVFVTYGFGNSLVANKNSDKKDFSTCFYFGLFLSILLYSVVFWGAPFFANFYSQYDQLLLVKVLRVMGLRIPLAAINSVQHAYVQKKMWFRKFFFATLIGTMISGVVSLIMAYLGFGVWALVEQYLGNVILDTICLWIIVGWRPTKEFSIERLSIIYRYGWKILIVGLIDTLYGQLRNLVIGKKYKSEDLAYYSRGYRFPSFGMRLIEPTVNSVLFPALSQCQDNQKQMRNITKRVLQVSTFIISPIMVGLAVISRPLVIVLLTEKWLPCVVYLQIGCFANLFRCQQFINNCVIKASGNSALLLKLDVIKKIIGITILVICMNFGVKWIAISLIAFYFISMIINIAPNRKILNYGYSEQFKDVFLNIALAFIMGGLIFPFSFLKLSPLILIIIQVMSGVTIYFFLSLIVKNSSVMFLLQIVKSIYRKTIWGNNEKI